MKLCKVNDSYSSVREELSRKTDNVVSGYTILDKKKYQTSKGDLMRAFCVTSPEGKEYNVLLSKAQIRQPNTTFHHGYSCNCWAFKKGNGKPCKHVTMVLTWILMGGLE